MILLTLAFTAALIIPALWALVELHTTKRSAKWLVLAIPLLVGAPVAFYQYGVSLMGYGLEDMPKGEWDLLDVQIHRATHTIFLLVREQASEPRLYKITSATNFEENAKRLASASKQAKSGYPVRGTRKSGTGESGNDPGDFTTYILPPSQVNPK